jgi:hypothetical protein
MAVKSKFRLVLALFVGLLMTSSVYADDAQEADDPTITVVGEGDTPDDVVKVIELPSHAATAAAAKSASGVSTANAAQNKTGESGRDFGQQVSEDARTNNGAQVREDAQQQAHSDARNDNASDKRHTPPH